MIYEPEGCGREIAEFYACATDGCRREDTCEYEYAAARACEIRLEDRDRCHRLLHMDPYCDVAAGRHGYVCAADAPLAKHCEPVDHPMVAGALCCLAFGETGFFEDPELTADEVAPDYSDVAFEEVAACVAFGAERGFCDFFAECACERCAEPLAACAGDYECLRGLSCSVDDALCSMEERFYIERFNTAALYATFSECYRNACGELRCP